MLHMFLTLVPKGAASYKEYSVGVERTISRMNLFGRCKRNIGMTAALATVGLAMACSSIQSIQDNPVGIEAIRNHTPEINSEVSIGESVTIGNLIMSVSGARASDGRDRDIRVPAPPDGYVYMLVTVDMQNIGDSSEDVSSRMRMNLLNADGQPQEWTLFPASAGSIDGRIGPGSTRSGELTWKVLENAKGLKLVFGDVAFFIGDASGYLPGSPDNKLTVNR